MEAPKALDQPARLVESSAAQREAVELLGSEPQALLERSQSAEVDPYEPLQLGRAGTADAVSYTHLTLPTTPYV